jgi:hypothetical protein
MPAAIKAPPYFCQLFFRDSEDDEGWSEGYWINKATYDEALADIIKVGTQRLAMLTPENVLDYIRVSSADIRGDTEIVYPDPGKNKGTFKGPGNNPLRSDPSEVCAIVRLNGLITLPGPPPREIPVHAIRPWHGVYWDAKVVNTDNQIDFTFSWGQAVLAAINRIIALGSLYEVSKPPTLMTFVPWVVTSIEVKSRLSSRKVGRPFGLSRGRLVAR